MPVICITRYTAFSHESASESDWLTLNHSPMHMDALAEALLPLGQPWHRWKMAGSNAWEWHIRQAGDKHRSCASIGIRMPTALSHESASESDLAGPFDQRRGIPGRWFESITKLFCRCRRQHKLKLRIVLKLYVM